MTIREDRLTGRIRDFYKIPTECMAADGLTKSMLSDILYDLISIGHWRTFEANNKRIVVARSIAVRKELTERDLENIAG